MKRKHLSSSCPAVGRVQLKLYVDQISGMQQTFLFQNCRAVVMGHAHEGRANMWNALTKDALCEKGK